jgi:hypothetical protein
VVVLRVLGTLVAIAVFVSTYVDVATDEPLLLVWLNVIRADLLKGPPVRDGVRHSVRGELCVGARLFKVAIIIPVTRKLLQDRAR